MIVTISTDDSIAFFVSCSKYIREALSNGTILFVAYNDADKVVFEMSYDLIRSIKIEYK